LDNGNQWFSMPVNLGGSGLQVQELHFTADGFPVQTSDNGGVITWTGTVITRGVSNPDDQYDDIIVELPPIWWSWLDEIVNRDLPKYVVPPVIPDTSPINLAMASLDSRVNFTRAGAASYVGSNGLIQQASANQWTLEYLGGIGRTEPEPASNNGLLRSGDVTNGIWSKTRIIVDGGFLAPDGSNSAVHLAADTSNNTHAINQQFAKQNNTTYTYSIFVKAAEQGVFRIQVGSFGQQQNPQSALINLTTGSIVAEKEQSRVGIQAFGDGWFRVWSTITTNDVAGSITPQVFMASQAAPSYPSLHLGDGISGFLVWGGQLEVGSSPSSYIPTVATQISRPAATAAIPANGASGIKISYSTGETATLSLGGASSLQIPAATKAWGSRYITLIEYLP
jgi:hypothetical protein